MVAIWRLGGGAVTGLPPRIESDEIYPVHMLDGTATLRGIVVTWTLRFNDVLDADVLYSSLSELLEIGDWRKLGGRLRSSGNGGLEIHVPQPFTKDRPAVSFSHQSHTINIEDHPLGSTLPKATPVPSIHPGPADFRPLAAQSDAPSTLLDFLHNDIPQLSLHITSFANATLVGLSWPHTLMDVMGQQALLRSWSLVLAGRKSDVPPVLGAREDTIVQLADSEAAKFEDFQLGAKQLRGWGMLRFGARFAWDLLWNRVVETRTLYLPASTIAELRRQAQSDLGDVEGTEEKPFISEGDVLTAFATRAISSSLPQPRPITVLHPLNARFRLPSLLGAPGVYLGNMAVAAFTLLSHTVATGPLGPLALANRQCLAEQATEGQVLAQLRAITTDTSGDPNVICGEADAVLVPFTNWTKAEFFNVVDFSAAVVGNSAEGKQSAGKLVFHHASSMQQNAGARNVVVILGKDNDGGVWTTGMLLPAAWERIREEVRKLGTGME